MGSAAAKQSAPGHISQLDSIRALAAIGVMFTHYRLNTWPNTVDWILKWGWVGVPVFFVLSGFLISIILLRMRRAAEQMDNPFAHIKHGLRNFIARRSLRIMPVYYAVVIFLVIVNVNPDVRQHIWWHLTYTSNIYMTLFGDYIYPNHFWTLCVEVHFYLLWPFVICFAPRNKLRTITLIAFLASVLCRVWFAYPVLTSGKVFSLVGFDCLLAGTFIALLIDEGGIKEDWLRKVGWVALGCFIAILATDLLRTEHEIVRLLRNTVLRSALAIVFFWVIARAISGFGGITGKVLENRVLRYLGEISYGIYIYHAFMQEGMRVALKKLHIASLPDIAVFLLPMLMTVAVAAASWHLFEKPINGLKRYFPMSMAKGTASPTADVPAVTG